MHKNHTLTKSFMYALEGLSFAFKKGRNFRIQVFFAVISLLLGLILKISPGEWLSIILISSLVLILELTNTAIESVVDLVSPELNPLAKITKDCSAGAVLIASLSSVIIGLIIFLPRIARFY